MSILAPHTVADKALIIIDRLIDTYLSLAPILSFPTCCTSSDASLWDMRLRTVRAICSVGDLGRPGLSTRLSVRILLSRGVRGREARPLALVG